MSVQRPAYIHVAGGDVAHLTVIDAVNRHCDSYPNVKLAAEEVIRAYPRAQRREGKIIGTHVILRTLRVDRCVGHSSEDSFGGSCKSPSFRR